MSLPEKQPEWDGMQPDIDADRLALIMCRVNIERLMDDAKVLGELVVVDSTEVELTVDVTECGTNEELINQETESVNFFVINEENQHSYRVRHDIFLAGTKASRQFVRKETWLFFDDDINGQAHLNETFSNSRVSLGQGYSSQFQIRGQYPGTKLSYDELTELHETELDLASIKMSTLEYILDVAKRALDTVRASALHESD